MKYQRYKKGGFVSNHSEPKGKEPGTFTTDSGVMSMLKKNIFKLIRYYIKDEKIILVLEDIGKNEAYDIKGVLMYYKGYDIFIHNSFSWFMAYRYFYVVTKDGKVVFESNIRTAITYRAMQDDIKKTIDGIVREKVSILGCLKYVEHYLRDGDFVIRMKDIENGKMYELTNFEVKAIEGVKT